MFLIFTNNVSAAVCSSDPSCSTYSGPNGSFDYFYDLHSCQNLLPPGIPSVTTPDLSPCIDKLGSYTNTCCTNPDPTTGTCTAGDGSSITLWQYNHATGCTATAVGQGLCDLNFQYATQTCNSTDTCYSTPYLFPGLCTQNGCAIGATQFKTCCNADGTVDGNCTGGEYTGTCTSAKTIVCGIASCAGVNGDCTTDPCGQPACNFYKQPTPPPCQPGQNCCTVGANCTNPNNNNCQGVITACPGGSTQPGTCECRYSCTGANNSCVNNPSGIYATSNCSGACPVPAPGAACNPPNVWKCTGNCSPVNGPTGWTCQDAQGTVCANNGFCQTQPCRPGDTKIDCSSLNYCHVPGTSATVQ